MAAATRDSTGPSRLARLAPGVATLRSYQRPMLRGDVVGGITVAAYLVPQVMAYAGVAGLPAVAGLWAIMAPLAIYALLGSSRQLSVGPESTTALMTAAAVGPLAVGDPDRYAALAAALGVIVGAYCLIGWAARVGFVADLLSRPVLIGYMAGVAMLMISGQLGTLTGATVEGSGFVGEVRSFLENLDTVEPATLGLGLSVLVFLFVVQRRFPRAPGPLLAVLLATAVTVLLDLEDKGVAVVGEIPAGLPRPSLPDVSGGDLASLLLPAVGVMIVGYTDNVLTARAFASRRHETIDANQELLALGTSNLGAGLTQGFPVSSSGSRTAIGDSLGARTQLYSLVALASVLVVIFVFRPVLAHFPKAALGAIVVYAATRLIDLVEFRRLARFRVNELVLAFGATFGVLVLGILPGVGLAIALSVGELLFRVARPHDAVQGRVPGLAGMHDVDDYPTAQQVPGLVVYRYDSPLFFANAENFRRRALEAVDEAEEDGPRVRWFLLNVEANVEVDITGLDAVEDLRRELSGRGVVFAMARVKQDLLDDLEAFGLADSIGRDRLYPTLPTAVEAYQVWAAANPPPP
jgi:high affinity sulfate transporter 1